MQTKVTDERTITVSIDGIEHKMSMTELQSLYDEIGRISGIVKLSAPTRLPYQPWTQYPPLSPNQYPYTINTPNTNRLTITCSDSTAM